MTAAGLLPTSAAIVLVLALCVSLPAADATQFQGADRDLPARLRASLQGFVEKGTIAGAVVLVGEEGKVGLLEAVGYQDLESRQPMRTDTIFQVRSMTKTVTALAVMQLVDDGRLKLDAPVTTYLPEFPSRTATIRHLLTHTSGLPAEVPEQVRRMVPAPQSLAELVARVARLELVSPPGGGYQYTDISPSRRDADLAGCTYSPRRMYLLDRSHSSEALLRGRLDYFACT